MEHRYAAAAFRRYCALRRLPPAAARAELELFDDLVLVTELRARNAARWVAARTRPSDKPAGDPTAINLQERASWTMT